MAKLKKWKLVILFATFYLIIVTFIKGSKSQSTFETELNDAIEDKRLHSLVADRCLN